MTQAIKYHLEKNIYRDSKYCQKLEQILDSLVQYKYFD